MLFAESTWYQRILNFEGKEFTPEKAGSTTKAVTEAVLKQNKNWEQRIYGVSETALNREILYTKNDRLFREKEYEIVLHVFNHGTYHRGQLVTMLRQAGVDEIPGTDFIIMIREEQRI